MKPSTDRIFYVASILASNEMGEEWCNFIIKLVEGRLGFDSLAESPQEAEGLLVTGRAFERAKKVASRV